MSIKKSSWNNTLLMYLRKNRTFTMPERVCEWLDLRLGEPVKIVLYEEDGINFAVFWGFGERHREKIKLYVPEQYKKAWKTRRERYGKTGTKKKRYRIKGEVYNQIRERRENAK